MLQRNFRSWECSVCSVRVALRIPEFRDPAIRYLAEDLGDVFYFVIAVWYSLYL